MIELKYRGWNDVSIALYEDIMKVITDEDLSDAEKDIKLIALMAGVDEDVVWGLPVEDVRFLRLQLAFLNQELSYPKSLNMKKLKIGDVECDILKDISDLCYGQYVDFQTYIKEPEKYRGELLSIFIYPKGKKYATDYDMAEFIGMLKDKMSIVMFSSILFFFAQRFLISIDSTLHSLALTLRMKAWLKRDKREKELIRKIAQEMEKQRKEMHLFG